MENPVSWFILLVVVIAIFYFSIEKAFEEKEQYDIENEKFFYDRK